MMFINNISYEVGSANAKLESDMQQQNISSNNHQTNSNENNDDAKSQQIKLDFELVKISCKKENDQLETKAENDESNTKVHRKFPVRLVEKIMNFVKFYWIFRVFLFLVCSLVIGFAVFKIVSYYNSLDNKFNMSMHGYKKKRDIHLYERYLNEWSGERISSIYRMDPNIYLNKSEHEISVKLDFIRKRLKFKCILLKNVKVELNDLSKIDANYRKANKNFKLYNLKKFIELSHDKSLKVLLDLDITGTNIQHKWYQDKNLRDIYLTEVNATKILSNPLEWSYDASLNSFYFSNGRRNFAHFNFDNEKTHDTLTESIKNITSYLRVDGIFFSNMRALNYSNELKLSNFKIKLKRVCKLTMIVIIGDYIPNDKWKNDLLNIFHVSFNSMHIKKILNKEAPSPFEGYLADEGKKFIWSLDSPKEADESKDSKSLMKAYLVLYSLPGICLIQQGHEIEINHQEVFNKSTSMLLYHLKNKPELSIISNISIQSPILNFFEIMNERLKPRLNDFKPPKPPTTAFPIKPRGPEPYKNSYFSFGNSYLKNDFFDFNVTNSLVKITRQAIKHSSLSIKVYRDILFLINMSTRDMYIENIINLPVGNNKNLKNSYGNNSPQMPIHIIYDLSGILPEYVYLNDKEKSESFYILKSGSFAILEY